jgi:hypothetical protein
MRAQHGQIQIRRVDGWRDLKQVSPLKPRKGDAQALADLRSFVINQFVKEKFQARIPKNRMSTITRDTTSTSSVYSAYRYLV